MMLTFKTSNLFVAQTSLYLYVLFVLFWSIAGKFYVLCETTLFSFYYGLRTTFYSLYFACPVTKERLLIFFIN